MCVSSMHLRALVNRILEKNSSNGFQGIITNTSLHDIVQLICIGRTTCRMCIKSMTGEGFICFRDGEVVHAELDDFSGEEAFYRMLSWDTGTFVCDEQTWVTETIKESWDFLLMESLRRIDRL